MMTHPVRSLFIATLLCGTLAVAALEVRSAKFGSDNHWADVTAAFREMRINDDLYFGWIDGNRMAGRDPAPGVARKLVKERGKFKGSGAKPERQTASPVTRTFHIVK